MIGQSEDCVGAEDRGKLLRGVAGSQASSLEATRALVAADFHVRDVDLSSNRKDVGVAKSRAKS